MTLVIIYRHVKSGDRHEFDLSASSRSYDRKSMVFPVLLENTMYRSSKLFKCFCHIKI